VRHDRVHERARDPVEDADRIPAELGQEREPAFVDLLATAGTRELSGT
jgi:hypothetical protein